MIRLFKSLLNREQMGFKVNRKKLIIRWVIRKVVSSVPPEMVGAGEARTCLDQACLEGKR